MLLTALISFLMHFQHFEKDLMGVHVWRQTQTQSTINNFYEEDMNILNPRRNERENTDGIFRMEFPLMQWTVAAVYNVFGNDISITRYLMFIIGLFSVFGIYRLVHNLFSNNIMSLMGAWAFSFSPTFFYYTINPLPDNLALCCAIWGIALFFGWSRHQKISSLWLSALLLAIAALCKLPFIIYFMVPATYFLQNLSRNKLAKSQLQILGINFGFLMLPLVWYVTVIPQWDQNIVLAGVLGHNNSPDSIWDYMIHNLISALPELLLNYGAVLFFLAGFYFLFRRKGYKGKYFIPMLSLSVMVLIYFFFEITAIAKIHDYYLFPFLPLLFILVAYGAYQLFALRLKFWRYFSFFLILLLPFTCYLRMQNAWNPSSPGFNKDLLLYKSELQSATPDNTLVVVGNDKSHFIFLYYINKKGWGFHNNDLNASKLEEMIDEGAKFLYTDSAVLINNPSIKPYLDRSELMYGSIKIYGLHKP